MCYPSAAARDREPLVLLVRNLLLITHKESAVLLETNSELNRRVAFVAAENSQLRKDECAGLQPSDWFDALIANIPTGIDGHAFGIELLKFAASAMINFGVGHTRALGHRKGKPFGILCPKNPGGSAIVASRKLHDAFFRREQDKIDGGDRAGINLRRVLRFALARDSNSEFLVGRKIRDLFPISGVFREGQPHRQRQSK